MANEDKRVIRQTFANQALAEAALIGNEGSQVYAADIDTWIFNNSGTFEYTYGPRNFLFQITTPIPWDVSTSYGAGKIVRFDSGLGVIKVAVSNISDNEGNDPIDNVDVSGPWTVYDSVIDLITWILLNKASSP